MADNKKRPLQSRNTTAAPLGSVVVGFGKTVGPKLSKPMELLFDAKEAGGTNSDKCTLILTVGDMAKSFAMAGFSTLDRDHYGVFSLSRVKLLNDRKLMMMKNPEIQNLIKILGLEQGKEYDSESIKSLRYRHLMIITHQDPQIITLWDRELIDGLYLKGLLINFLHSFWPSLMRIIPSFLVDFVIPDATAIHGQSGSVMTFYSMPEFESWRESNPSSSWHITYYHGLAFHGANDIERYFSDIDNHKRYFVWEDEEDDKAIKLAFSKSSEERKVWLRRFEPGAYLDRKEKLIKLKDFVNRELIMYPMANHQRVIPSMVDGLKLDQRKILFCILKLNLVEELSVPQLFLHVQMNTASKNNSELLMNEIAGMTENFVGSNNINLLEPESWLGKCRSIDGKYKDIWNEKWGGSNIKLQVSPITRYLFHKDDDVLLDYLKDKGNSIEPTWYMPVIPTVLVNGSQGVCTEYSTSIPKYNPRDIIANIRRLLNGEPMKPMNPWYKGFKGIIEKSPTQKGGYTCTGVIEVIDKTTLHITEIPIGRRLDDYMKWLLTKRIRYARDHGHGLDNVDIKVVLPSEEEMARVKQKGLVKKFNLTTRICTSNMHLFDSNGVIKKYDNPEEIIEEFYHLRLAYYDKRKKAVDELRNMSSQSLWIQDLDALEHQLDDDDDDDDEDEDEDEDDDDDDEDEDDDDDEEEEEEEEEEPCQVLG